MGFSKFQGGALVIACAGLLAACSQSEPRALSPSETQLRVDGAVQALKNGALIRALNEALDENPNAGKPAQPLPGVSPSPIPTMPVLQVSCEGAVLEGKAADAAAEARGAALVALAGCMRDAIKPVNIVSTAISHLKVFNRGVTQLAFSRMTDEQLAETLEAEVVPMAALTGVDPAEQPRKLKLRNTLSERDLMEFNRLGARRNLAVFDAQSVVFALVDSHRELIEHFAAAGNNRYGLLLALRDTWKDETPDALATQVLGLMESAGMELPEQGLSGGTMEGYLPFVKLLHPFGILAVVPDRGKELLGLQGEAENPMRAVFETLAGLGGPQALVKRQVEDYLALKARDNPRMPELAEGPAAAARVAVLDSGVDYVKYPELGVFLSRGSFDFADNDPNPFLPDLDADFGHGSHVTASLLTTLAHYAPEALRSRRVQVAVLKTKTLRDALALPFRESGNWDSRHGAQEALITLMRAPEGSPGLPGIVSISLGFRLQEFLERLGLRGLAARAPWLWVMAAGNEGREMSSESEFPSCLGDVPSGERSDARILCVGAIKRGILADRVAAYSNHGDRVDVYAYESHIDLCPSGTSCAAPAVSAAAAAVAALGRRSGSGIRPERIKELVIQASEERELQVEGSQARRRVRVFDPATMMGRLLKLAD